MSWLTDILARFLKGPKQVQPDEDGLELAGKTALAEAVRLWQSNIYDPPRGDKSSLGAISKGAIDDMIRTGLGWFWEPPYAGDGSFEWCGAFAATCWSSIKPALRRTYFASTYRIDRYARGWSVSGEKNDAHGRLLAELDERSAALPWMPRAGDILTVGPVGSGYGKHICLVEAVEGSVIRTIEGNGTGLGPNNKRRQGVVRGMRAIGMAGMRELGTIWHARRIVRPAPSDLVG